MTRIYRLFSANFIGFVFPALIGFFSIIYLQQKIEYAEFATLSFIFTILNVLGISDLGFSRISARESAAFRLNKKNVRNVLDEISDVVICSLLLSILIMTALVCLIYFLLSDEIYKQYLYALAISTPLFVLNSVFRGVSEGNNDFYFANFIKIFFSLIIFIFPVIQVIFFKEINFLNYVQIVIFIRFLTLILFYLRNVNLLKGWISRIFKFNSLKFDYLLEAPALAFGGILGSIIIFIERGIFESSFPAIYPIFFIAHEIIIKAWIMPAALSLTVFPTLANITKDSSKNKIYQYLPYIIVMSLIILILIPIFIYILSNFLELAFTFSNNFYYLYLFMTLGIIIGSIAQTLNIYILASRQYLFIVKYSLFIFVIYFISLSLIGKVSILYFFILWNLRYLADFIFIYLRFKKE